MDSSLLFPMARIINLACSTELADYMNSSAQSNPVNRAEQSIRLLNCKIRL